MTPQLWIQFLTFQDWKLTHPDLTDQEATLFYKAELQMFQNYQDEIRNQTIDRRDTLANDVSNLGNDISDVLIGDPQGAGQIQEGLIVTSYLPINIGIFRGLYKGDDVSRIPLKKGERFRVRQHTPGVINNSINGVYESLIDFETFDGFTTILTTSASPTTAMQKVFLQANVYFYIKFIGK